MGPRWNLEAHAENGVSSSQIFTLTTDATIYRTENHLGDNISKITQ